MKQAWTRLLELRHHMEHWLAYKKRTEIKIEMGTQLEDEGRFPQADYGFGKGVFTFKRRTYRISSSTDRNASRVSAMSTIQP